MRDLILGLSIVINICMFCFTVSEYDRMRCNVGEAERREWVSGAQKDLRIAIYKSKIQQLEAELGR